MRSIFDDFTNQKYNLPETKATLDTLHLKSKKFTHADIQYRIMKYDKRRLTPETIASSGLFRSVIFNGNQIRAFSQSIWCKGGERAVT